MTHAQGDFRHLYIGYDLRVSTRTLCMVLVPSRYLITTIRYLIYQLIRYAKVCTQFLDLNSKKNYDLINTNFQAKNNVFINFTKILLLKFGSILTTEYISLGISHPPFYGNSVNHIWRIRGRLNFLSKCIIISIAAYIVDMTLESSERHSAQYLTNLLPCTSEVARVTY